MCYNVCKVHSQLDVDAFIHRNDFKMNHFILFSVVMVAIKKMTVLNCSGFRLKSRNLNTLKSTGFRKQLTIEVIWTKFQGMPMLHQFYIFRLVSLNTALNVCSTAMFYSLSMLRKVSCKKRELYVIPAGALTKNSQPHSQDLSLGFWAQAARGNHGQIYLPHCTPCDIFSMVIPVLFLARRVS